MRKLATPLLLGALLIPAAVSAQAAGEVDVTATVISQIAVNGDRDLEFGTLVPGFARTIEANNSASGRFAITGGGNFEVSLDFDLPSNLDGPSGATMPITFGANAAGWGTTSAVVSGTFDPGGVTNRNLSGGELWVFIGGTVTPAAGQASGAYAGVISLDVAYTGS
jgi:hypothetical protein